ncbi:MAG TPA: CoA-acylating methylmalonate-semialdehyde dehydrogenase [Gammaproteobacteria bacterium]|nr:CoA-acylating methylmalonate-semialdehyde dehydrogenase [Gammaproteobacteria bacterium]
MSSATQEAVTSPGVVGHLIGGERVEGGSRVTPVYNPATGQITREAQVADAATIERAVSVAAEAYPAWRQMPPVKRARILFRFKELLEKNKERVIALITDEHGKVLADARGELRRGIENVEYACAAPELLKGEHNRNAGPGIDNWSEKQPLGIVLGITPFNFPAMVPLWMYPIALACGNTFMLKPSEHDPSSTLLVAELLYEAGLPKGVLNVVNGDKETVDALLADPRVVAVSFVGSTPVAERIYGSAKGKRVQALGGAKNHAIVMPDADVDNAVNALMGAAYGSCGERCMAISVVVTVGDVADEVVDKLAAQVRELKIGPGTDDGNDMGPLVTGAHRDKVKGYVNRGVEAGAELIVDGRGILVPGHEDGFFLGGNLFDRVEPGMDIYTDEIFGPVLCIVRVGSLDEAMQLVDDHEFGNGTCIFTRDGETARYFSDHVKAGMVGINVPLPVPVACHSFGGWKRSLFGDLAIYGPDAVRFYTQRKTMSQRWPASGKRERVKFSFPSND